MRMAQPEGSAFQLTKPASDADVQAPAEKFSNTSLKDPPAGLSPKQVVGHAIKTTQQPNRRSVQRFSYHQQSSMKNRNT